MDTNLLGIYKIYIDSVFSYKSALEMFIGLQET